MTIRIIKNIIAQHNNQNIYEYQLIAQNGFQVNVLNYGAIISKIFTHDKYHKLDNIVVGYDKFDPTNPYYAGSIVGRVCGRISNAKFILNDIEYLLNKNNNTASLHGGNNALDKQIWQISQLENGVELTYLSPDKECGYPGNVYFRVKYIITDINTLSLEYFATSDAKTIVNLTNHCYFDLSVGADPMGQCLTIDADNYAKLAPDQCFYGHVQSVANTPLDFRVAKPIKQDINTDFVDLKIGQGYDLPYILNTQQNAIILQDSILGRKLTISTTDPVCVLYSGNFFKPYRGAVCLETQRMTNAINNSLYRDSVIIEPSNPYVSNTTWSFNN